MANRYWVGGTATWDTTVGTKWALTSGGAGGQAVPTSTDDVFFDAASGTVTVTTGVTTALCKNLNFTGFTGIFAGGFSINISGSLTLVTTMTFSSTGNLFFTSTSLGNTVTTAGKIINSSVNFGGVGGEWILQDNLVMTGTDTNLIQLDSGILRLNNKDVTCSRFLSNNSTVRSIYLGSGTITLFAAGSRGAFTTWDLTTITNLTFDAGTSTISITSAGTNNKTFAGGGLTYYNLIIKRTATHIVILSGSNTFNTITINATDLAQAVRFTSSTTQTVTSFVATGSSGKVITIDSVTAGTAATLSKASGVVNCDYLSLKDSAAIGGAGWYAGVNSSNIGGNTGWLFTAPTFITGLSTIQGISSIQF